MHEAVRVRVIHRQGELDRIRRRTGPRDWKLLVRAVTRVIAGDRRPFIEGTARERKRHLRHSFRRLCGHVSRPAAQRQQRAYNHNQRPHRVHKLFLA